MAQTDQTVLLVFLADLAHRVRMVVMEPQVRRVLLADRDLVNYQALAVHQDLLVQVALLEQAEALALQDQMVQTAPQALVEVVVRQAVQVFQEPTEVMVPQDLLGVTEQAVEAVPLDQTEQQEKVEQTVLQVEMEPVAEAAYLDLRVRRVLQGQVKALEPQAEVVPQDHQALADLREQLAQQENLDYRECQVSAVPLDQMEQLVPQDRQALADRLGVTELQEQEVHRVFRA